MSEKRRPIDRLFRFVAPGVDGSRRPAPLRLADGVWSLERYLRMPGGALLPSRTTLVLIELGGLAVISPPPPDDATYDAIDGVGRVEALIAPNSFHHLYVNDAARRYPAAKVYLAPGLADRVPTLPPATDLSLGTPSDDLEPLPLGPLRGLSEVFLFHRPSRTLILSDAAFNMVNLQRRFDRLYWRAFGVPNHFGPSRTARIMLLNDRRVASAALRRVLDWPFEQIVVAHGEVVQADARACFERGFAAYL